jgi:hypothetical protein
MGCASLAYPSVSLCPVLSLDDLPPLHTCAVANPAHPSPPPQTQMTGHPSQHMLGRSGSPKDQGYVCYGSFTMVQYRITLFKIASSFKGTPRKKCTFVNCKSQAYSKMPWYIAVCHNSNLKVLVNATVNLNRLRIRGPGGLFDEKYQRSKISCYCLLRCVTALWS